MRPAVRYTGADTARVAAFSENPSHRRSGQHPGYSTLPTHNREADPAQHLHPIEHGPTDAARDKELPPPSTQPTASRFSAHNRSTSPVNKQNFAHEALSAQTICNQAMRPQQLTLPSRQSLLHGTTENHKPEQVQIITIYNCSTKRWIVERTFAWLNWSRRLSKDYNCAIPQPKP